MAILMPEGKQSFSKGDGTPLVGGKLYTYDAGTNNPRTTYQDSGATTPNTNPVILDARGEAVIFWAGSYKVELRDALNNLVYTVDNVFGPDVALAGFAQDLASTTDATKGAGQIGFSYALGYALGSVGRWLKDLALGTGSGFIGWLQNSAVAVLRTVRDKLFDTVSVKDFGAIGDGNSHPLNGVTSLGGVNTTGWTLLQWQAKWPHVVALTDELDWAASQAAVNYVTNGTVDFPAGAYKFNRTLKINYSTVTNQNCVNLRGVGQGASIYWNGPDNVPMVWYEGTSLNAGFYSSTIIEKLYFNNQNLANGLIGIKLGNFASVFGMGAGVLNVTIRNNKFIEMYVGVATEYESDGIYIYENVFEHYRTYGVYNVGSASMRVFNNQFSLGRAGSVGVYCEYSSISICDNLIQSTEIGVTGAIFLKNVSAFNVTGNYLENGYTGPAFAINIQNCNEGYIGHNTMQGMQGADCINIDSLSSDIEVGPNAYGFFGFPMASHVNAAAGSRGINVLGNQDYILAPVSINIGTPAIVTSTLGVVGMQANQAVYLTSTGILPTGLTQLTTYYVKNVVGASFELSLTPGGASVATTGAGAGVHKVHIMLTNALKGSGFNFVYDNNYLLFGAGQYSGTPNPGVSIAKSGVINVGNTAAAAGWGFMSFNRSGVNIGGVTQSGTTGVAFNTTSDEDLKDDLGLCESTDIILNTKVHDFSWKQDGTIDRGVFAQEAYNVKPSAVRIGSDERNEEGHKINPWGVDYSKYVPDLIVTCQQLHKMVLEQREIIEELRNQH